MVAQARDDEQPPSHDSKRGQLSLKARFASGTVEVRRRGGQRLMLRDGSQLRLGDTLITRGASQLTLLFPGHQWIVARGTLRLIVVPPRNALAGRISVALLAGTIRARGNRRGGVSIHHGRRRRLQTADGEMRVSLRGGRLVISSIDATIDVRGPHARRTVSAGLGLTLSGRPGFAHALLSAPTTLRPVLHRGLSAPMLSWKAVARARAYRVLIGRDADFFNVVERAEVKATRYKPRLSGMVGKFYWKIVALGAHRGAPSKVYGFRVTSGSLSAP